MWTLNQFIYIYFSWLLTSPLVFFSILLLLFKVGNKRNIVSRISVPSICILYHLTKLMHTLYSDKWCKRSFHAEHLKNKKEKKHFFFYSIFYLFSLPTFVFFFISFQFFFSFLLFFCYYSAFFTWFVYISTPIKLKLVCYIANKLVVKDNMMVVTNSAIIFIFIFFFSFSVYVMLQKEKIKKKKTS